MGFNLSQDSFCDRDEQYGIWRPRGCVWFRCWNGKCYGCLYAAVM